MWVEHVAIHVDVDLDSDSHASRGSRICDVHQFKIQKYISLKTFPFEGLKPLLLH